MSNDVIVSIGDLLRQECPWLEGRSLTPEDSLRGVLGLDSVALVGLMVAIEDRFDLRFVPDQVDLASAFETLGSLAATVEAMTSP